MSKSRRDLLPDRRDSFFELKHKPYSALNGGEFEGRSRSVDGVKVI